MPEGKGAGAMRGEKRPREVRKLVKLLSDQNNLKRGQENRIEV